MKVHNQSYRPVSVFGDEFVTGKPAAIGSEKKKKGGAQKSEKEKERIVIEDIIIDPKPEKPILVIVPRANNHLDEFRTGADRYSEEPKR